MSRDTYELNICEIIEELKNIGLDRPDEIIECLYEYTQYCTVEHDSRGDGDNSDCRG